MYGLQGVEWVMGYGSWVIGFGYRVLTG